MPWRVPCDGMESLLRTVRDLSLFALRGFMSTELTK